MPLFNVEWTILLNWTNLYFLLGDEELAQPASSPPFPYLSASNSSQPSSSFDYASFHATLQCIQDEHASLHIYIQTEHTALCDFV